MIWLLLGGVVGAVHGWSLRWTVSRLYPGAPLRSLGLVLGGAALRWGLVVLLLIVALQEGSGAGLLAFAGQWLAQRGTIALIAARG